jgi:tetratricopeptide (TPR) repeat protein
MPTDNTTPEPNAPTQACSRCGCVSPLTRLYHKAGRAGVLCPRCYVEHAGRQQRNLTLTVALAVAWLAAFALLTRWAGLGPPYLLGNLLLIVFAMVVSIVGHELAHALAGWLTGGRVIEIRLGAGPDLFTRRLGGLLLRVRRYLAGGACTVVYPPGRQQRWRTLILYSAGLLFHLLLIAALLPGFPHEDLFTMWAWRDMLFIANLTLLALVLLTRQALTQDGLVMADATQLRQILSSPWDPAGWLAGSHSVSAYHAWLRGDFAQAEAEARAGTAVAPPQPFAMNMHGVALLGLGRYAEARAVFEALAATAMEAAVAKLVPDADHQALFHAMNRNNLAYALLMAQAAGPDLQRARDLAEAAFAVMPWDASIEGTLGAALVETGAVEAGLRHLEAAGAHYDTPRSRASNLAWRAWGHQRLGQTGQAQALLEEAARLDGAHPGLPQLRQRIEAADVQTQGGSRP